MSSSFSRSLSFLRQEKSVSQRIAAQELGVSQALLSHYENGIREPGLNFVLRACDYYGVSADFLLGRTLSRDGTVILDAATLLAAQGQDRDPENSTTLAALSKNLLAGSGELLFGLLAETGREDAVRAACNYLSTGIYTLFRHLYQAEGKNSQDIFSVSAQKFALGAAKADMIASEMAYVESLSAHVKEKGALPDLSHEALTRQRPVFYQSLLHIIHMTGARINKVFAPEREPALKS